jgi:hypothetical protein
MRSLLNVIADILTLVAIAVAGVGHMLPWFRTEGRFDQFNWQGKRELFVEGKAGPRDLEAERQKMEEARQQRAVELMEFQSWHALRSGVALGGLTILVALSLAISWGPVCRRFLVLLMFGCALAALLFITLSLTHYPITETHRRLAGTVREDDGFLVALVPTCFALAFCLIRMIWTMPPQRVKLVETPPPSRPPRMVDEPPQHMRGEP